MSMYIEDLLHLYVDTIGVDDADKPILTSISKQCKKGVALTDRQYELVKNKLTERINVFEGYVDGNLYNYLLPRLPIRQIDRSKYIKLVTHAEMLGENSVYESYKENWIWVKVRFPFAKKLIGKLDQLKTKINNRQHYYHVKGSHEHYFKLSGEVVYWLIETFKGSHFEVDDKLVDYYKRSKEIIENPISYRIEYADGKFKNLSDDVLINVKNLSTLNIVDRRIRYGYSVAIEPSDENLTNIIAFREQPQVCIDPEQYTLQEIAESLKVLDRLPILVLIDNDDKIDQVKTIHEAFDFVDNKLQSVLFRVDSEPEYNLNDYVKEHGLNNWVDKNTQIVYIKKNQLPKIVFSSGFTPITALALNSYRSNSSVENYINFNCDLIVFHDKEKSMFGRYATKYGFM